MKTWHYPIVALVLLTGCLFTSANDAENQMNYSLTRQELVTKSFENVSQTHLEEIIIKLSSFPTRNALTQGGIDSFIWIESHLKEITKNRSDVEVTLFKHKNYAQPSIILTVKGSDPVLKDEIIVVSAHGDSINYHSNESIAPGADDNASGVAVCSEILRRLVEMDYKPKRSFQVIIYAAEEHSDRASYELTRSYRQNNINVIGVLNYDQTNYKTGPYDMVLIDDLTSKEQNMFLANIIDTYLKVPWTWQSCGYPCTDHDSWNVEGYRASSPGESLFNIENPNIHSEKDTFETSGGEYGASAKHSLLFVKLGLAFVLELDK